MDFMPSLSDAHECAPVQNTPGTRMRLEAPVARMALMLCGGEQTSWLHYQAATDVQIQTSGSGAAE